MELFTAVTNALVVGAVGLLLAAMSKGLRDEVRRFKADVDREFTQVRAEIGQVRSELRGELGEVRTEIRELRSDLTQVALAVGARPQAGHGN